MYPIVPQPGGQPVQTAQPLQPSPHPSPSPVTPANMNNGGPPSVSSYNNYPPPPQQFYQQPPPPHAVAAAQTQGPNGYQPHQLFFIPAQYVLTYFVLDISSYGTQLYAIVNCVVIKV